MLLRSRLRQQRQLLRDALRQHCFSWRVTKRSMGELCRSLQATLTRGKTVTWHAHWGVWNDAAWCLESGKEATTTWEHRAQNFHTNGLVFGSSTQPNPRPDITCDCWNKTGRFLNTCKETRDVGGTVLLCTEHAPTVVCQQLRQPEILCWLWLARSMRKGSWTMAELKEI